MSEQIIQRTGRIADSQAAMPWIVAAAIYVLLMVLGPRLLADPDTFRSAFYLRFTAVDRPGVLAKVAGALGAQGVSIAQVVQKDQSHGNAVPILVLTHECEERALRAAVREIDAQKDAIAAKTVVVHVEQFQEKP